MFERNKLKVFTMIARMLKSLAHCLVLLLGYLILITLAGCQEQHLTGVLNPKGIIAHEQRRLFFDTLALMLIVVLPVIVMSFAFVYHYQVSHRIRDYKPNWGHSYFLETLWWGIPCLIIVVLAILTWRKTHELDPFKRITPYNQAPLLVQVIALPWKWLFIYPQQDIATVNYLMMPVGQQVEFWITTDNVPMSAFFIPQIGSQIYTMTGMRSRLHLLATHPGHYEGMNTQFNGGGFSDMHFIVHVVEPDKMQQWFNQIKQSPNRLTVEAYSQLLKPSIADSPQFFSGVATDLFKNVIATYLNSLGPVHPRKNLGNFNYSNE
jgi:cytochrome o ubiquinol oxidase subunit II